MTQAAALVLIGRMNGKTQRYRITDNATLYIYKGENHVYSGELVVIDHDTFRVCSYPVGEEYLRSTLAASLLPSMWRQDN